MASNHSTKSANRVSNQAYRKTPKGAAACAWNRLTSRAGAKYNYSRCYASVEVRITREEFLAWAIPEYSRWFAQHPNQKPSIDRISSEGHYELGNLRIIEVQRNRRRAKHFINDQAPSGTRWCKHCQAFLPLSDFAQGRPKKGNPTGLSGWCRRCGVRRARESFLRLHPPEDLAFKKQQKEYNRVYKVVRKEFQRLPPNEMAWKDFVRCAMPLYLAYFQANPQRPVPRIVRADTDRPYQIDNLRLLPPEC